MKIKCESKNAFIALKRLLDKYEIHYVDYQGIDEYDEEVWDVVCDDEMDNKPGIEPELEDLGEKYFYAID